MDPRSIILERPMGTRQVLAVGMCIVLNALDGFDVLSISFASPGIAAEWNIDRAALGIVLSMELIGMALGSVLIGNVADRIGRRPTILGCLIAMAIGMGLAATADGVTTMSIYRLLTGLGIGGMLAAINAMTAEFANARRRNLAVGLMAAGYPIGAVIGGSIAALLLATYDWRAVFVFGCITTTIFIPLAMILLPESIEFLSHKRPPDALERINATLRRLGHPTVNQLPPHVEDAPRASLAELFTPNLVRTTVLLTVAYFAHIMTFYYILKWIPKIVADMGFPAAEAGGVLVWANVGGATGALLFSFLTQRFGLRPLVILYMLLTTCLVVVFGQTPDDLGRLSLIAAVTGFFSNAVIVGIYALLAQSFPTSLRAGGTGFVVGTGRGGAALGPIAAGFLFDAGWGLPVVSVAMAAGSLIGAIAVALLGGRRTLATAGQQV